VRHFSCYISGLLPRLIDDSSEIVTLLVAYDRFRRSDYMLRRECAVAMAVPAVPVEAMACLLLPRLLSSAGDRHATRSPDHRTQAAEP